MFLMEITGTKAAFLQMISKRGVYKELGVDRSTVSNWKRTLNGKPDNSPPSIDKMEEMLLNAGAIVVSEKIWDLNL